MTTKDTKKRVHKRANNDGCIFFNNQRGKWMAQLNLGINPKNGRTITKTRSANTKTEAALLLNELKAKYATSCHVDSDGMTVSQWLLNWFETYVVPRNRPNTQARYRAILTPVINDIGSIKLNRLTELDLQKFIFNHYANHYCTARFFRMSMRSAFKRAVLNNLIEKSPAENLELPKKQPARPFVKPTKETWKTLLEFKPMSLAHVWRMVILTEYVTGARLSELMGLKWSDLQVKRDSKGHIIGGSVHIQRSVSYGIGLNHEHPDRKRPLMIFPPKTSSSDRVLPLPPYYIYEIQAFHKSELERRLRTPGFEQPDFIFTNKKGKIIPPQTFSSIFSRETHAVGIKTTFHMLRHDMASRMKSSKFFDMKDIQTQLGHASIKVTMDIYTHLDDEEKKIVGEWLEDGMSDLFSNGKTNRKIS